MGHPLDNIKVLYVPGAQDIVDMINTETGLTWYGRKAVALVQADYPGAEVMSLDAALGAIDAVRAEQFADSDRVISREAYYEALGALPPTGFTQTGGFEVFKCSERTSGDYTAIYARCLETGQCFSFVGKFSLTADDIIKRVAAYRERLATV